MSWDIFVQDLPKGAKTITDIPRDFKPMNLNLKRDEIIKIITEVFPKADFKDKTWGRLDGDDFSIEINLGDKEYVDGFALHVRGSNSAVPIVDKILHRLGVRAVSSGSDIILDGSIPNGGFEVWEKYKNEVTTNPKD